MATIIIKNSTGSGVVPSSLVQGELAINTKDGRLFYGSGSGNIVKEFTGSGGGGGSTFPYTGSAIISGSLTVTGSLIVSNSIDSNARLLYDSLGFSIIDWENKELFDSTGASSITWDARRFATPNGNMAFRYATDYIGESIIYYKHTIGANEQESFSTSSLTYSGQAIGATVDVAPIAGDLVYLNTDGIWYVVDQTTNTSTKLLGINIDGSNVLLEGDITLDNITSPDHGLPLYIREANGRTLTSVIPTSGYVRIIGHCYYQNTNTSTNWVVKFRPANDWYKI